jgi:pilus assembly protein Flp/PilA
MMSKLVKFLREEEGASLVEYALLVALIALLCLAALTAMGGSIRDAFNAIAAAIGGALGA